MQGTGERTHHGTEIEERTRAEAWASVAEAWWRLAQCWCARPVPDAESWPHANSAPRPSAVGVAHRYPAAAAAAWLRPKEDTCDELHRLYLYWVGRYDQAVADGNQHAAEQAGAMMTALFGTMHKIGC
jgi:hypothetical protein